MEINIKTPKGVQLEQEEINAYITYIKKNNPKREIEWIEIIIDEEDYANLTYSLAPVDFERIRRITGYLVGTTKRWNNGKQSELRDRVQHGGL